MIWIDQIVNGVIEQYGNNVFDICHGLEIPIVQIEDHNAYLLKENQEALYQRHNILGEIIYIRDILDDRYNEFVLAHEIGHAVMHTHVKEATFDSNLINSGKLERQANYFALKLLSIEVDFSLIQNFTAKQIASLLHISKNSVDVLPQTLK